MVQIVYGVFKVIINTVLKYTVAMMENEDQSAIYIYNKFKWYLYINLEFLVKRLK